MKPGASKDVVLKLALRGPADDSNVRLSIWDTALGEVVSQTIKLPSRAGQEGQARETFRAGDQGRHSGLLGRRRCGPVIGQARSGAILRSDASFRRLGPVWVEGERFAFVRSEEVKGLSGTARTPTSGGVKLARAQAAPIITLDNPGLVANEPIIHLKGAVSDERHIKTCLFL